MTARAFAHPSIGMPARRARPSREGSPLGAVCECVEGGGGGCAAIKEGVRARGVGYLRACHGCVASAGADSAVRTLESTSNCGLLRSLGRVSEESGDPFGA